MSVKNSTVLSAIDKGETKLLQILLNTGGDPNFQDYRGWAPLHHLCCNMRYSQPTPNAEELAQILIAAGADVNLESEEGNTPLSMLMSKYEKYGVKNREELEAADIGVIRVMLEAGAKLSEVTESQLSQHIKDQMNLLLVNDASINAAQKQNADKCDFNWEY